MAKAKSHQKKRRTALTSVYIILTILAVSWIFPIVQIILTSLRGEGGALVPYTIPKTFTLKNCKVLLVDQIGNSPFVRWFLNILLVFITDCLLSTLIAIAMAYALLRLRFHLRKPFLRVMLALNIFSGFMSMIAVYYISKALNLTEGLFALILVYSAGSALGFHIAKGFFDTIPMALDEPAMIDGANKWQIFTKITLLLSKLTTVYISLTAFMGPWMGFAFAKVIMGDKVENCTVVISLSLVMTKSTVNSLFVASTAGCILVVIPITILFILTQRLHVGGVTSGSAKGQKKHRLVYNQTMFFTFWRCFPYTFFFVAPDDWTKFL